MNFFNKLFLTSTILVTIGIVKSNFIELKDSKNVAFNNFLKSNNMNNSVIHKSETRGEANHGWLKAKHSFSFGNYYNPERMNFGVLRVLNDDIVDAGMGFGTHPHNNMEIITIPLEGDLEHKDSMGNAKVINQGDIQIMSAGTGITHSEYNKNQDRQIKLLQIWIIPNKQNVTPRYDQISLKDLETKNEFYQVLSPNSEEKGVWLHQDAWFHLGKFDQQIEKNYTIKKEGNGLYVFVIEGTIEVNGIILSKRDAFGIWNVKDVNFKTSENSYVLLMDVPMKNT